MLSLYVQITKDSEYLGLTYYNVMTQFSDEQGSESKLVTAISIENLLESFLSQIEHWNNFNKVTISVLNDDELKNKLNVLTRKTKVPNYTKALNECFPTSTMKSKYKFILSNYQFEIM